MHPAAFSVLPGKGLWVGFFHIYFPMFIYCYLKLLLSVLFFFKEKENLHGKEISVSYL